jgi:prepilin-type N-terminal cleavage/methylation domain-containing protein
MSGYGLFSGTAIRHIPWNPDRRRPVDRGFTLIELLVVVTVIVVLLALLMPAMGRAVYQSQLAVCGSQLRNIGSEVSRYALDNKRFYPDRGLLRTQSENDQPAQLKYASYIAQRPIDQRVVLRKAFADLNKQLNDPLSGAIDIDGARSEWVFAPYNLWWAFRYTARGTTAMERLDDRWDYDRQWFNIIASDRDLVRPHSNFQEVQTSHPDGAYGGGICFNNVVQDAENPWLGIPGDMTITYWWSRPGTSHRRGPVDNNYVMGDLSVQRHLTRYDAYDRGEMRAVGTYAGNQAGVPGHLMYVP